MDQIKIGSFMKELRSNKNITQEQFSEILGVSNKTISRWENGKNMPDIILLIEISNFYEVEITELLNGERKSIEMDNSPKEMIIKVADYNNEENIKVITKLNRFSIFGIVSLIIYLSILYFELNEAPLTNFIEGLSLGCTLGLLLVSAISTSKYGNKLYTLKRSFKDK